MTGVSLRDQIISQLDRLSPEQQQLILDYTRSLLGQLPQGIRGEELIALAHEINFTPEDLDEIIRAIEEDCGRIDWDGWQ